ncbi:DUF6361 family protein [Desulfoferrobacter suflitae]|uniref:DUF6361 family protein n=1 Tax=Desulfoferrobacter suflitae TaxID=2865782 RepID=UPI002164CFD0|nr:DUF6361 family protein [Desulfoferrobacter suflitae]MCK8603179.1 DUF6361 family protein [Desulfoferrobacter suflitae]
MPESSPPPDLLFDITLPRTGDKALVDAPKTLRTSAIEAAYRLANGMKVKRAELTTSFSWIDFADEDRQKMLNMIQPFREQETRDEWGVGTIRDAFADHFLPGTSTICQRRPDSVSKSAA